MARIDYQARTVTENTQLINGAVRAGGISAFYFAGANGTRNDIGFSRPSFITETGQPFSFRIYTPADTGKTGQSFERTDVTYTLVNDGAFGASPDGLPFNTMRVSFLNGANGGLTTAEQTSLRGTFNNATGTTGFYLTTQISLFNTYLPSEVINTSQRAIDNDNGALVLSAVGNLSLRASVVGTTIGTATPAITGTHDLGGFGVGRTHDVEFTAANAGTAPFRTISVGSTIRVTASLATAGNSVDATVVSITPRANGLVDFMFRITVVNGSGIPLSPGTISVALITTGTQLATARSITPSATNLPLYLNLGDVIDVASGANNYYVLNQTPINESSI